MSDNPISRRQFLQLTASAAAMLGLSGCAGLKITPWPKARKPRPIAPGAKVRVVQVGCGGMGGGDIQSFKDEQVVALCDVDWSSPRVQEIFGLFPEAKRYKDFRQMLIEMDDQIDAVVVSTPDHMHFLVAYMAIAMGKHVYCQKPLTQTIAEARELQRMARKHGVATQMGNQGHAGEGIRLVREWIQGGVIGPVRKVDIWTNRPIWPQGMAAKPAAKPIPAGMDWDLYMARCGDDMPFSDDITPFKWRGWRDFGAGALGDMGCHTMDAAFWALNLGDARYVEVEATSSGLTDVAFPTQAVITYKYPARGDMPPVTVTWYEGTAKPQRPAELEPDRKFGESGQLYYGDKGKIMDITDYCQSPRLIPESAMQAAKPNLPPKTIARVPENNPYKEWLRAIRGGVPAGSNFDYSVPLSEFVLLGNLAILSGQKIEWDSKAMRVTNNPEANKFVHQTFRKGWRPQDIV